MPTPYLEELALVSRNNEAISRIVLLTKLVDGVRVPVDLTGRTFFSQARYGKSTVSDLVCNINVSIYGDPLEGRILLSVSEDLLIGLSPLKGHYDVITRTGSGPRDNLYVAPFIIEGGVSNWD